MLVCMMSRLAAQAPPEAWDPGSLEVTRPELVALRDRYQQVVASSAYSGALKQLAEDDLARVSERLDQGDFRTGDRIILRVQGEETIPDTLVVEPGPAVTVPIMGRITLAGVLRSELQDHMRREVARFIQNPVVETRSLIRISVQGSVGRPGFYVLPADLLVGDVIMTAGGPTADADLSRLRVERGEDVLLEGQFLQAATVEGRSLDQLNLRAGDALVVPPQKRSGRIWLAVGRFALLLASSLLLGRAVL